MKTSISSTTFLVLFLAIQVSADLIDDTCKKTPTYDLCVTTLRSDPSSSKANLQGLALIAATKLQGIATITQNQIGALLGKATDPNLKLALNACKSAYHIILALELPPAIDAIKKGNPTIAGQSTVDVPNETDKCRNGIASTPVARNNKIVHDLGFVVLSIIRLLL